MGFIEVKDLKVHYPIRSGFFNRVTDHVYAVDGVNIEFEEGKTYGLVGESGSGKSTIGKAIIGLERATSGQIIYEGQDVTNKSRGKKGNFNRDVQMIFQDSLSSFNPKNVSWTSLQNQFVTLTVYLQMKKRKKFFNSWIQSV